MGTIARKMGNGYESPAFADMGTRSETDQAAAERFRYRVLFQKVGLLKFTSHLDLARIWERTLRRAGIPLVYSQGFNPRPKIQLAAGLPLGCTSICELVDFWTVHEIPDLGELPPRLNRVSPSGLTTVRAEPVSLKAPSLQSIVTSATYEAQIAELISPRELNDRISTLLSKQQVWRERREKTYDLRPLIETLRIVTDRPLTLEMILGITPDHGAGRPDEVLEALSLDPALANVNRTSLQFPSETQGSGT